MVRHLIYCNDINIHREHKIIKLQSEIENLQQNNEDQTVAMIIYCIKNQGAFMNVTNDAVMKDDIRQLKDYIEEYELDKFNSVIEFKRKYGLN